MIKIIDKLCDAYPYVKNCPICKLPMINSIAKQFEWDKFKESGFGSRYIKLVLPEDDHIEFDVYTGAIIDFSLTYSDYSGLNKLKITNDVYEVRSGREKYILYDNNMIVGSIIDCLGCSQYSYTLQLFVNIDKKNIDYAKLNSEFVCISENSDVYEIKNSYTLDRTEYTHINNSNDIKTLMLPLVSKDMLNPNDVLRRIKKLVIFS